MTAAHTPGPWTLCRHLESIEADNDCSCGYRGVIFGPEHDVAMAICQPGHDPAPRGEEGTEPCRYSREVELANSRLIAAAPELLSQLQFAVKLLGAFPAMSGTAQVQSMRDTIAKARGDAA